MEKVIKGGSRIRGADGSVVVVITELNTVPVSYLVYSEDNPVKDFIITLKENPEGKDDKPKRKPNKTDMLKAIYSASKNFKEELMLKVNRALRDIGVEDPDKELRALSDEVLSNPNAINDIIFRK